MQKHQNLKNIFLGIHVYNTQLFIYLFLVGKERDTEKERGGGSETERDTERDRKTDRRTERERERQTERQRDRERQTDRQTETQTQTDRETDTDRETEGEGVKSIQTNKPTQIFRVYLRSRKGDR